jgi:hypothetical protein
MCSGDVEPRFGMFWWKFYIKHIFWQKSMSQSNNVLLFTFLRFFTYSKEHNNHMGIIFLMRSSVWNHLKRAENFNSHWNSSEPSQQSFSPHIAPSHLLFISMHWTPLAHAKWSSGHSTLILSEIEFEVKNTALLIWGQCYT